jgi:hypothetical protein
MKADYNQRTAKYKHFQATPKKQRKGSAHAETRHAKAPGEIRTRDLLITSLPSRATFKNRLVLAWCRKVCFWF